MPVRRRTPVLLAAALLLCACTTGAEYTFHSENDFFGIGNRDRYYTNGLRISGMHRADATPDLVRAVAESLPELSANETTQVGWVIGQDIYTPSNTRRDPPDPRDRPYAGWLYAGVLVSKAVRMDDGPAGDHVDVVELDVGVAGPPSLAHQTQVSFHHLIGVSRPQGWKHELDAEPGVLGTYEHRRRLLAGEVPFVGGDWDAIGSAGAGLGNVSTHASAGGMVRWGSGLRRDFGPNTIHATAVDVPDIGTFHGLRAYVFCGAEGRAVARILFLDGNTFRDGPSVDSRPFIGELRTGVALELGDFRLGYTHVVRSEEFHGQPERHAYGSLSLTWGMDF